MALEKALRPLASTLVRKVGEQAARGKPFYSPVDQAIANITQGTGTGAQMLAELLKTKGVAKELKDRPAIKKALEAAKDTKVTKTDVERLATENPPPQVQQILDESEEFKNWQMGGGKNHRNLLIRLPNPAAERNEDLANQIRREYGTIYHANQRMAKYPHLSVDELPRIAFAEQNIAKLRKELADLPRTADMYESPHWGTDKNVLAHARVADYEEDGKKVLLIDEIQSDWHQAARDARKDEIKRLMEVEGIDKETASKRVPKEFGYAMPETQRIKGVAQPDDQGGYKVVWEDGTFSGGYSKEAAEAKALEGKSNATSGAVPDAPFKQNWHELVIKRLLDDAARNGYSKVLITPGAEQTKRYDLSKQIGRVVYNPETETLNAFDLSNKSVIQRGNVKPNQLEDYIGKDPAKRLLDQQNTKIDHRGGKDVPYQEISGLDLQIGGEGMTGFYDQIIPTYLNDYGKKYGAQVGTHSMVVPPKNSMEVKDWIGGDKYIQGQIDWELLRWMNRNNPEAMQQVSVPFHSFDITPQMREDITTKGMPLYQVAPPVAIGAGAAMQEEEPAEYAGGGAVKKALKAVLPKGQQAVLPAAESAANLERFLAESAVKDRLYHGTSADITKFNPSKIGAMGPGVYVTTNPKTADAYAGVSNKSPNLMPLHAQVKNPFPISSVMKSGAEFFTHFDPTGKLSDDEVVRLAKKAGYDAVHAIKEGELNVFHPSQLKSAIGNRGTYDITDPDINMAGGGLLKKAAKGLLPKGQQAVLPAAESAANLERFLADSAVKDRLYHATPKSFSEFKPGGDNPLRSGPAIWMTPSKEFQPAAHNIRVDPDRPGFMYGNASNKFTTGTNVMPLYSSIKNPLYTSELTWKKDFEKFGGSPWTLEPSNIENIKSAGFDGVVYRDKNGDVQEVLAFQPEQVKSAIGNRGTYDINEADINKAKGGQVSKDAMWMAVQNKQIKKRAEGGAVHMAKGGDLIRAGKSLMRMKNRMTAEPFAKPSIVKEPGGNWLMGSVEQSIDPLKITRQIMTPEKVAAQKQSIETARRILGDRAPQATIEQMEREIQQSHQGTAINQWIERNLANYIKKQMATPEDPVRKLAEQGIVHMPPEQMGLNATESNANRVRERLGTPRLGQSPEAQAWEDATDVAINPLTIKDVQESRKIGMPWAEWAFEPWMKEADPQTKIFRPTDNMGARYLGFDHIVDELKNAINPLSGLPRELQIKPESLSKLSMSQAVERVAKINAWREAQKAEANAALAMNPATVIHREYPTIPGTDLPNERGLRWVEMQLPESRDVTKGHPKSGEKAYEELQDALKYEGETMGHCVGGYCPDVVAGKTRIYSLRDAKGQPHVTIEVRPGESLQGLAAYQARYPEGNIPSEIVQIKGKANRKPNEEYLPFVQDFVRSGQWSDVGDIQNTGMRAKSSVFSDQELARLQEAGAADIPHILTGEEIQRLHNMIVPEGKRLKYDAAGNIIGDEAGYAKGGAVSCDCDHDAMQFAVWDKQLRKKHGN